MKLLQVPNSLLLVNMDNALLVQPYPEGVSSVQDHYGMPDQNPEEYQLQIITNLQISSAFPDSPPSFRPYLIKIWGENAKLFYAELSRHLSNSHHL